MFNIGKDIMVGEDIMMYSVGIPWCLWAGGYGVYSEECSVQCVFNVKKQYKQLFK